MKLYLIRCVFWVQKLLKLFDSFQLNDQAHELRESEDQAIVHTIEAAVKGGFEVTTTHLALQRGVLVAVEVGGFER